MQSSFLILAQAAAPAGGGLMGMFLPMVLIVGIF